MKYISAEQFLKARQGVQDAIIEWWKPSKGDIYCNLYNDQEDNVLVINECQFHFASFKRDIKQYGIPLLTEGQLREFIENKTGSKMEMEFLQGIYDIYLFDFDNHLPEDAKIFEISIENNDLLQVLWKVACKIVGRTTN